MSSMKTWLSPWFVVLRILRFSIIIMCNVCQYLFPKMFSNSIEYPNCYFFVHNADHFLFFFFFLLHLLFTWIARKPWISGNYRGINEFCRVYLFRRVGQESNENSQLYAKILLRTVDRVNLAGIHLNMHINFSHFVPHVGSFHGEWTQVINPYIFLASHKKCSFFLLPLQWVSTTVDLLKHKKLMVFRKSFLFRNGERKIMLRDQLSGSSL